MDTTTSNIYADFVKRLNGDQFRVEKRFGDRPLIKNMHSLEKGYEQTNLFSLFNFK